MKGSKVLSLLLLVLGVSFTQSLDYSYAENEGVIPTSTLSNPPASDAANQPVITNLSAGRLIITRPGQDPEIYDAASPEAPITDLPPGTQVVLEWGSAAITIADVEYSLEVGRTMVITFTHGQYGVSEAPPQPRGQRIEGNIGDSQGGGAGENVGDIEEEGSVSPS